MAAKQHREPAEGRRRGRASVRRGERQAGQDRQPDRRRRGEVADVPDEGDRLPLLAGGGQRREHVGDRGEQDDGAEHPQERLARRARARRRRRRRIAASTSGQRKPNESSSPGKNQSDQTSKSVA